MQKWHAWHDAWGGVAGRDASIDFIGVELCEGVGLIQRAPLFRTLQRSSVQETLV